MVLPLTGLSLKNELERTVNAKKVILRKLRKILDSRDWKHLEAVSDGPFWFWLSYEKTIDIDRVVAQASLISWIRADGYMGAQ